MISLTYVVTNWGGKTVLELEPDLYLIYIMEMNWLLFR